MVIFDILEVNDNLTEAHIKAHINGDIPYSIDRLVFIKSEDFGKPLGSTGYTHYLGDGDTEIDFNFDISDGNFSKNDLLIVYIIISKNESDPVEEEQAIGVTFNTRIFYNEGLKYIKEVANTCKLPQNFANFVLLWESFNIFIKTGNYTEAIKVFNKLFKKNLKAPNCE